MPARQQDSQSLLCLRGALKSSTRGGYCGLRENDPLFQRKTKKYIYRYIFPKKKKNAERTAGEKASHSFSPTEVSSGPGTRHATWVTLPYFTVTPCFINILFPLQKASVIIHSAFSPFALRYSPRQEDKVPRLNQMTTSWSWWSVIKMTQLSTQGRLVFQ